MSLMTESGEHWVLQATTGSSEALGSVCLTSEMVLMGEACAVLLCSMTVSAAFLGALTGFSVIVLTVGSDDSFGAASGAVWGCAGASLTSMTFWASSGVSAEGVLLLAVMVRNTAATITTEATEETFGIMENVLGGLGL